MPQITTLNFEENTTHGTRKFGARILFCLEQQGKPKSWLAEQIGISKQALNYLLNHSTNPKYVNEIANILEVSPEWLLFERGPRQYISDDTMHVTNIPIYPFNEVASYIKNNKKYAKDFTHFVSDITQSCFATRLENSSMEPLFLQGTLLIFNSQLKPKNRDYVIFRINSGSDVFFRQYFVDGTYIHLKSADNLYKSFNGLEISIFGVLVESRNHFTQRA